MSRMSFIRWDGSRTRSLPRASMRVARGCSSFLCLALLVLLGPSGLKAQDAKPSDVASQEPADARQANYKAFEEMMNGVKLVGNFTVLGRKADSLPKEEYTINSVKKLPIGEKWLITARVKYGELDLTVPMPLDVMWAGDTPVITLTDVTIPGLGTFSSRVVLYNGKYAGTWTHGEVGGHLFGTIEKIEADDATGKSPAKTAKDDK